MIDTHCHLTYAPLFDRLDAVLAGAREAGVDRMITIGTGPEDAGRAVALARRFPHVFAAVGLHPHYAAQHTDRPALVAAIHDLARESKVVAIGEMGLDRHYSDPPIAEQVRVFEWQLQSVQELPRPYPVVIHNRRATDDTLAILRHSGMAPERFVFHCFTGDDRELDAILEFGAMVSFTGVVTFKNSQSLLDRAARVPLERVMIETDSPYLTPAPHRKVKVNEPKYVVHVAKALALRREMREAAFIAAVDANAQRFFGLP